MVALRVTEQVQEQASAQLITPRDAPARRFTAEQIDAGWFTQEFPAQVDDRFFLPVGGPMESLK